MNSASGMPALEAGITTSGPMSAISVGALRGLLMLSPASVRKIRHAVEQADEGGVPHRLFGRKGHRYTKRYADAYTSKIFTIFEGTSE
jgi:hypothetical protein